MAGVTRQIVFAIDPYRGIAGMHSWDTVPDGNADEYYMTCAYAPPARSGVINPLQESIFIGTGGVGTTLQSFREDLAQDDGAAFTAEAITCRLDPSMDEENGTSGAKRYHAVEFLHTNPYEKGASVSYCKEEEAPHRGTATWTDLHHDSDENFAYFPAGVANWIHLKITDASNYVGRNVFNAFKLYFYELFSRGKEAT